MKNSLQNTELYSHKTGQSIKISDLIAESGGYEAGFTAMQKFEGLVESYEIQDSTFRRAIIEAVQPYIGLINSNLLFTDLVFSNDVCCSSFGTSYKLAQIQYCEEIIQPDYKFSAGLKYAEFNTIPLMGSFFLRKLGQFKKQLSKKTSLYYTIFETEHGYFSFESKTFGNGGYGGYVAKTGIENGLKEVIYFLQACNFCKDVNLFTNHLGGLNDEQIQSFLSMKGKAA